MSSLKQALVRPIEISATNNTLTVTWSAGGPSTTSIDPGMYGSIYAVVGAVRDALDVLDLNLYAKFTSEHKVRIGTTVGTISDLSFDDTDLGRLLGYRENSLSGAYIDAVDTPLYCWIPTYYTYDEQRFHVDQKSTWKGGRSVVGQLSGVRLTTEQYTRVLKWDAEPATNVFISANETEKQFASTGAYYKIQADRCFEQFMVDCRAATLTQTTSRNLNPKGCYYIHDWSGYYASSTSYPDDPDSGGVAFYSADTLDTYVYCTPSPDGPPLPQPLSNTAKNYYSVEIELTTGTAPTWNKP